MNTPLIMQMLDLSVIECLILKGFIIIVGMVSLLFNNEPKKGIYKLSWLRVMLNMLCFALIMLF